MTKVSSKSQVPVRTQGNGQRLPQIIERAAKEFEARSLRFTELRQKVFAEIAATTSSIGAYDILERLAEKGVRLAPISIYRSIDALMEVGVVHRLESKNAYFACRMLHGNVRREIVLSCERCGAVTEVEGEAVFDTITKVAKSTGFQPRVRFVEVSGLCSKCADKT